MLLINIKNGILWLNMPEYINMRFHKFIKISNVLPFIEINLSV